ncbi:MAG: methyltransferase domain-containing protein [Alphaproteobacteria bacterium]|nr:methyltransferase domain-containing protein [Alphaproteobacteria bacterium]
MIRLVEIFLRLVPAGLLARLIGLAAAARARGLAPDEGLRFLFAVQARLDNALAEEAVRYGLGVHPKHRHMRYHDFFVTRITAGQRVLDVGCGNGYLARRIAADAGAAVVGVDIVAANIEKACRLHAHERVEFRIGDILREIPAGGFDVIAMSNVLEHLPGRPELLRRLAEATGARRFLIRVPNFERDWTVPLKKELGIDWRSDSTHETEHTSAEFEAEIDAAGLLVRECLLGWGEIWAVVEPR